MTEKKKIVVIAGGNGGPISINALKQYRDDFDLSSIAPMSDSGGSSGQLRKEFGVLPPGDIMRHVLAMSSFDYQTLKQIFYRTRFSHAGKLDGHNLGNLFLVLGQKYDGDFLHALTALHQAIDALGTVYPVTLEPSDLCVELTNGETIVGEHAIDRPTYDRSLKIKRAWLEPSPHLFDGAEKAIEAADVIVVGPGSLYTSIVPILAVEGAREAIGRSKANIIFVAGNARELHGETGPKTLSACVAQLEAFLPRAADAIVYNNHVFTEDEQAHYAEKQWGLIAFDPENLPGRNMVAEDYEKDGGGLSSEKLGEILKEILKNI